MKGLSKGSNVRLFRRPRRGFGQSRRSFAVDELREDEGRRGQSRQESRVQEAGLTDRNERSLELGPDGVLDQAVRSIVNRSGGLNGSRRVSAVD